MKKTILISTLVLGTLACAGCGAKKTIEGSWAHQDFTYTFNKDKTCSYNAAGTKMTCTYTVDGDKLSILYDGNTVPFETTFKIDGKTLSIKDSFGSDIEYTRK